MFKKRLKQKVTSLTAFHSWMERKKQELLSFLQKRTLHWSKRKKVTMLALIVLLFGGFYALLLISVIKHENRQADYLKQEHIHQVDSSFNRHLKELNRKKKPIKPP